MDLIANALTNIRNAVLARHTKVEVSYSKMLEKIIGIMQEEGYVRKFQVEQQGGKKIIRLFLRQTPGVGYALKEINRISRSSRRIYKGYRDFPATKNNYGICIVSTSRGVMTTQEAAQQKLGGEIVCNIF